jgi:predicted unusual protein kinase regulating ubiquinone biosynthesis (AarF/ABC1/UbiB family)
VARAVLVSLRDLVPPLPAAAIAAQVEAELGAPLGERFARFDPEPIGAASIAQVHRAELPDGRAVAVKVQYPWLGASLEADLRWIRRLVRLVLPAAGAGAAFAEFARGVREEIDFAREARIAEEIAANLAGDAQVVVPRAVATHSTPRVLTMELHSTLPLERDALAARGVAPEAVMEIVARAYARQIFQDGLFHADPHPGNLFVIDEPDAAARPRVLFVDFGLSHRLSPELRRELRAGVLALLQNDLEGFLAAMRRMQMVAPGAEAGVREAVAKMFARVRGEGASALALSGDRVLALKDEATQLLYATPGLALPSDLLLYAKTVSYLFALGREIAPGLDLMRIAVPYLLRFLASREPASPAAAAAGPAGG